MSEWSRHRYLRMTADKRLSVRTAGEGTIDAQQDLTGARMADGTFADLDSPRPYQIRTALRMEGRIDQIVSPAQGRAGETQ
jgi:hypothetical protein